MKNEVHWRTTASGPADDESLTGDLSVDVAIVGGGLTGCRTALGLAEAGVSVALLDAREIGWGASGRSGGQCNPIWRKTPQELAAMFGPAQAERLIATTLTAADDLFHDIRRYQIDCDAVQAGWLQAAHCRRARRGLEELGRAWSDAGAAIETLEGAAFEAASGSPAYSFALRHRAGGHVQPLSLTRGFARAARTRGARLYSHAPVASIHREGGRWCLRTSRGSVRAEKVVLATNAYTDDIWPGLRHTFYPMVSIAMVTAPLPAQLRARILPGQVSISDTRLAIYFARYDRDGRLIFGCVGSADRVSSLGGSVRLKRGLRTVFPELATIEIERSWSGRICVTPEMMPHLHEPAPGVLAALGYSGRGIAMTSVMGRALASRILGGDDTALPFPVKPIKRIQFHDAICLALPLAAPAMTAKDRIDTLIGRT